MADAQWAPIGKTSPKTRTRRRGARAILVHSGSGRLASCMHTIHGHERAHWRVPAQALGEWSRRSSSSTPYQWHDISSPQSLSTRFTMAQVQVKGGDPHWLPSAPKRPLLSISNMNLPWIGRQIVWLHFPRTTTQSPNGKMGFLCVASCPVCHTRLARESDSESGLAHSLFDGRGLGRGGGGGLFAPSPQPQGTIHTGNLKPPLLCVMERPISFSFKSVFIGFLSLSLFWEMNDDDHDQEEEEIAFVS